MSHTSLRPGTRGGSDRGYRPGLSSGGGPTRSVEVRVTEGSGRRENRGLILVSGRYGR